MEGISSTPPFALRRSPVVRKFSPHEQVSAALRRDQTALMLGLPRQNLDKLQAAAKPQAEAPKRSHWLSVQIVDGAEAERQSESSLDARYLLSSMYLRQRSEVSQNFQHALSPMQGSDEGPLVVSSQ